MLESPRSTIEITSSIGTHVFTAIDGAQRRLPRCDGAPYHGRRNVRPSATVETPHDGQRGEAEPVGANVERADGPDGGKAGSSSIASAGPALDRIGDFFLRRDLP